MIPRDRQGRPIPPAALLGQYVHHPQYGWITFDNNPPQQYMNASPIPQMEESTIKEEKDTKTPSFFVVRSKADIEAKYIPDISGRLQVFVQKEENEDVNYIHLRQLYVQTGLIEFETYKRVTDEDISTETVSQQPSLPNGMMDILISTVENLNNKLDSIDQGIKSINMEGVLDEIKELKKEIC